ncbi:UNVERIFIED_CONTAM: hypothetical protein K2H54_000587 [Gekko kuhli]
MGAILPLTGKESYAPPPATPEYQETFRNSAGQRARPKVRGGELSPLPVLKKQKLHKERKSSYNSGIGMIFAGFSCYTLLYHISELPKVPFSKEWLRGVQGGCSWKRKVVKIFPPNSLHSQEN